MPKSLPNSLVVTAAVIGILQGIIWTALSLIGIALHEEIWEITDTNSTVIGSLALTIYEMYFLEPSEDTVGNVIVNPNLVYIATLIYLTLSLIWCFESVCIIVCIRSGKRSRLKAVLFIWVTWTVIISGYDAVVASFFLHDFIILNNEWYVVKTHACGVLMIICARGVVLWLCNILIAIFIFHRALHVHPQEENEQIELSHLPPIDGYNENRQGARMSFQMDSSAPEWDTRIDYNSNSTFGQPGRSRIAENGNGRIPKATNKPSAADVAAEKSQGKAAGPAGLKSYIPRIPRPDYSPPSNSQSRESFRSALRIRSEAIYGNNKQGNNDSNTSHGRY